MMGCWRTRKQAEDWRKSLAKVAGGRVELSAEVAGADHRWAERENYVVWVREKGEEIVPVLSKATSVALYAARSQVGQVWWESWGSLVVALPQFPVYQLNES